MRHIASILSAALCMGACASMAQQDVPAVLVEPTDEVRAELQRAVTKALNTSEVTISPTALTSESGLAIERTPLRDRSGQRMTGRDFEKPEHFRLVKHGEKCVLVHERTSERYELKSARCVAVTSDE